MILTSAKALQIGKNGYLYLKFRALVECYMQRKKLRLIEATLGSSRVSIQVHIFSHNKS